MIYDWDNPDSEHYEKRFEPEVWVETDNGVHISHVSYLDEERGMAKINILDASEPLPWMDEVKLMSAKMISDDLIDERTVWFKGKLHLRTKE